MHVTFKLFRLVQMDVTMQNQGNRYVHSLQNGLKCS